MPPSTHAQTRELPALTMRAAFVPSTLNEEKRTVDLVWTTGARVMRGYYDRYWEELSLDPAHVRMGRLQKGAPLLDSHRGYSLDGIIGVTESAALERKQGVATVRFARAEHNPDAERYFRMVADGIITNVSVGYRVHRLEKVEEDADKIPIYRATDWEPYEISLVPMGADADAGVRAAEASTNPCVFVRALEDRDMPPDNRTDTAAPSAPTNDTEKRTAVDVAAVEQRAVEQERARIAGIQDVARKLGLPADFAATHVSGGTTLDSFRSAAIDELARKPPIVSDAGRPSVTPGEDARDKWLRGAESWLLQRSSVGQHVVEAAKKRGDTVRLDPGEFHGLTMLDLARQSLERQGVRTAGMGKMELIGKALTERGSGGYAATGDFPVLLENTLHKTLLAMYSTTPDTWSRFCATGSVSDFRAHPRYKTGSFSRLDQVNEHGEFRNKAIPDGEKESISASTYGNIIAITRQALVNDDMSAFSRLATMLGRAARLSIEVDVYATLALNGGLGPDMNDGNPLFDASHANISDAAALSVAALDADRVKMAEQTDVSGNEILDLRPAILVVPIGLGGDARVINDAQFDVDAVGGGSNANKFMKPNKVRGLFRDIVDTPRMTGTRRYLFADPAIAPVIEVAFLDGASEPYMEMQDGWRVDGVEWKIRLDYGIAAIDYRGAITNAGA